VRYPVLFVGVAEKILKKIKKAGAAAAKKGQVVVLYHRHPDVEEIQLALDQANGGNTTVVESSSIEMLETLLVNDCEHVLVQNAHKLPLAFQLDHCHTKWPNGWIFLTPKPPKELAGGSGVWAISFFKNCVLQAIPWRNFAERPRRDMITQIKETISETQIEVPKGLLEDHMQGLSLDQIAGVQEVAAMAETMITSAWQANRTVLTAEDVLTGMMVKNAASTSHTNAVNVAKATKVLDDETGEEIERVIVISPKIAAQLSRWNGQRGGRRNSTYFVN